MTNIRTLVQSKRIVENFLEIVKINSPSGDERNMADYLRRQFADLGFDVEEDDAGRNMRQMTGDMSGAKTIRFTGNVIVRKKGTVADATPILFAAHMDTVVPNQGVKPTVDNGVIRTDGTTILGADDKAGIAALMEAAQILVEKKLPHGDITMVFTIAEETGLFGSRLLDTSKIHAKMGFVLDSGGPPDVVIGAAPTEVDFSIKIHGKTAHSGVDPENGINAIAVAGHGLAQIVQGRIDEETTLNIGVIQGGKQTNIVCDYVELLGECRSQNPQKITWQLAKVQTAFAMAAEKFGARMEMTEQKIYDGFQLTEEDDVVMVAFTGAKKAGLSPRLEPRGGGSDTNIFNAKGIPAVNLGVGASHDHTHEENVTVRDLESATALVLGIVESVVEHAQAKAGVR